MAALREKDMNGAESNFKSVQIVCGLFFLALALLGLSHAALLPPFEGADETAHYSRIKAEAFPPADGNADMRMAADTDAYTLYGPMSPGWIVGEVDVRKSAPFAKPADALAYYMTYDRFFADPALWAPYKTLFRQVPVAPEFRPSFRKNWQYQHPSAYYRLMAPVMRAAEGLPLAQTVFVLRVASLALTLLGIGIGFAATAYHFRRHPPEKASLAIMLCAAVFYPCWMPTMFVQMGRLGNDSLCYVAVALVWAALLWQLRNPRSKDVAVVTGLTLGFATMVKMTLFPLIAAAAVFLTGFYARRASWREGWRSGLAGFAPALIVTGIAALVYFCLWHDVVRTGASPVGRVLSIGTVWAEVKSVVWRDAFMAAVDSVVTTVYVFLNWLFIRPSWGKSVLYACMPAVLTLFYIARVLRRRALFGAQAVPFWFLGAFMGGLLVYGFVNTQLMYRDGQLIPGYYIHVYAAFIGVMYGLGAAALCRRLGRGALVLALLAGLAGTAAFVREQALFYAGCLLQVYFVPQEGVWATGAVARDAGTPCASWAEIFARLDIVAWPALAAVCFITGLLCALAGIAVLWRLAGGENADSCGFFGLRGRFSRVKA